MEKTIAYIKNNRDNLEGIKDKILEFVTTSTPMTIRNFFVRCDKTGLPAVWLAYHTMLWLAEGDRMDVIESVNSGAPENALYGIYRIGLALADFRNYKVESGALHLREGFSSFFDLPEGHYKNIPDGDLLMRNAFLLEDFTWPNESPFERPLFEVVHDDRFPNAPYTCCVVCDLPLFERGFETFVQTLHEKCGSANIFFLLVNPDEHILSSACRSEGSIVARTEYNGRWQTEFATLSRFMLANDILDAIGGPTIFMDVDAIFCGDAGQILSELSKWELGVFDTGEAFPSAMISRKFVVSRPCNAAKCFWESVENFVLRGFARIGPLWGLGETALFVAASEAKEKGYPICELNGLFNKNVDLIEMLYGTTDGAPSSAGDITNDCYDVKFMSDERRVIVTERMSQLKDDSRYIKLKKTSFLRADFDEVKKLIAFMKKNASDADRVDAEILNFTGNASIETLHSLFAEFHRTKELHFTNLILYLFQKMTIAGQGNIISAIFETSNEKTPLFGLYGIGKSFADFMRWEVEAGAHHLREGFYHSWMNDLQQGANLSFAMQNAFLLENLTWPSSERFSMPPYRIVYNNRSEESPYTCCLVSDPKYFNRYWDLVIGDFRAKCPDINVFLTLINPTDDIISRAVGAYRGENITVARIEYTGEWMTEFCHLTYYLMFYEAMKITGKPVVTIETDAIFPSDIRYALDTITKYPLGYTDTNDPYPLVRLEGSTLSGYPSEDTFAFWDMVVDNMLENFMKEGPIYCFNQMALYVAVCKGRKAGWNMVDIDEVLKGKQAYYFKGGEPLPLEEKKAVRTNSKYVLDRMTEDRRMLFRRIA